MESATERLVLIDERNHKEFLTIKREADTVVLETKEFDHLLAYVRSLQAREKYLEQTQDAMTREFLYRDGF